MTWKIESTLGSEAMDFSRGEEGLDSRQPQVPGPTSVGLATQNDSRWNESDRNHRILVSSLLSEFPKRMWDFGSGLIPVRQLNSRCWKAPLASTPFSQKVSNMRRSRFGEAYSYREIGQIGSGGFGNCFLLERSTDKTLRVCKIQQRAYCYRLDDYEDGPIEASILRDILPPHDRILRLHEVVVQTHTVQLYYDFYDGGDLNQLIRSYRDHWQQIPEEFLWHAYQQISEALAFIHHGYNRRTRCPPPADWVSIIHGDVKDKNIFLSPPDPCSSDPLARVYPSLILGDFGLADLHPSRRWGTPIWQPPELPMLSQKSDVWGAGAVIHSLAHKGKPPILGLPNLTSNVTWDEWCENPDARQAIPLVPKYSHDLQDCVLSALDVDPVRRLTSYHLYSKVTAVWNVQIAPYIDVVAPLIPAYQEYDENGVTLNAKERAMASGQDMAAKDALEAKTAFTDAKAPWPYGSIAPPAIAISADCFGPSLSSPSFLSALAVEKQAIMKQAIREDGATKVIVEQAFMASRQNGDYIRKEKRVVESRTKPVIYRIYFATTTQRSNMRSIPFSHTLWQQWFAAARQMMMLETDNYENRAFMEGGVGWTETDDKRLDIALSVIIGEGIVFSVDSTGLGVRRLLRTERSGLWFLVLRESSGGYP